LSLAVSFPTIYNAAEFMGASASGYSSGQAIKTIEEVMKTMRSQVSYEWSGLTLQEKKSEGQAPVMTSFAFIPGCVPLMLASGSGAASRSTMGTGVVYGMTIATAVGLFIIPLCYVFVQRIVERGGKKKPVAAPTPVVAAKPEKGGAH
jgi:multidrug efflux pump subunit AcrB